MATNLSKFVNGYTTAENIIRALATELTVGTGTDAWPWELVYPKEIGDVVNQALVKTKVVRGTDIQEVFVEFYKPLNTEGTIVKENQHYIKSRFGSGCRIYPIGSAPESPLDGDAYVSPDAKFHRYSGTTSTWSSVTLPSGAVVMDPTDETSHFVQGGAMVEIMTVEVGSALPAASGYEVGDMFLDKEDGKLYTNTGSAWNAGSQMVIGAKFIGTDGKLYTVIAGVGAAVKLDAGTIYTLPWGEDEVSEWADWAWFRRKTTTTIKKWLPVTYWMRITSESMSCVLMGDPNADFEEYLISFGYFGAVKGFDGADMDLVGNFGMTVSSDKVPEYSVRFGDKTGTCCTDITMLRTRSGFPFQTHLLSMTTPDEFADKHVLGPSNWTHKYHMSPAYLYHGVDGYRGELQDVIVTDRASIVHLDQLVINKGLPDEKIYQYFALNAPFSMFNNSSNVLYGVALMRSVQTEE